MRGGTLVVLSVAMNCLVATGQNQPGAGGQTPSQAQSKCDTDSAGKKVCVEASGRMVGARQLCLDDKGNCAEGDLNECNPNYQKEWCGGSDFSGCSGANQCREKGRIVYTNTNSQQNKCWMQSQDACSDAADMATCTSRGGEWCGAADCTNVQCPTNGLCWDNQPERQVGSVCCGCPPNPCSTQAECSKTDMCWDQQPKRQIGQECCTCPANPNPCSTQAECSKTDMCWDQQPKRQIGQECCTCPPKVCTGPCPTDICPDGQGRRQMGDDCCACPQKDCSTADCKDLCPDGQRRRPIGDDCCACPAVDCASQYCTMDVCWDGKGRRQIGDRCCECPDRDCSAVPCTKDLCWDGQGRRPIGSDCCACPEKVSDCDLVPCTKDLCWDGKGRRPIDGDCCACPPVEPCATALCTDDVCWDGQGRRKIGDDCCACPEQCATAKCAADLCPDGKNRRKIGDDCCACPADCATTPCPRDLCPDGSARRPIGDDCCACPLNCDLVRCHGGLCPDGVSHRQKIGDNCCECPADCTKAMCPEDLCSDGKGRRPIGDDCCACPTGGFSGCEKTTQTCKENGDVQPKLFCFDQWGNQGLGKCTSASEQECTKGEWCAAKEFSGCGKLFCQVKGRDMRGRCFVDGDCKDIPYGECTRGQWCGQDKCEGVSCAFTCTRSDGSFFPPPKSDADSCCGDRRCCDENVPVDPKTGLCKPEPDTPSPPACKEDDGVCKDGLCKEDERCERKRDCPAGRSGCCPSVECVPKERDCGGEKCETKRICARAVCSRTYVGTQTTDASMGTYGKCVVEALPKGSPCDDNNPETEGDYCENFQCVPGKPTGGKCTDKDFQDVERLRSECLKVECDPDTGVITRTPREWGAPCKKNDGERGVCNGQGECEELRQRPDDCYPVNKCDADADREAAASGVTDAVYPTVCWDGDKKENGQYDCECEKGLRKQGKVCVVSPDECSPQEWEKCLRDDGKACKKQAGVVSCEQDCKSYEEMCKNPPRPGCVLRDPKRSDGCPALKECEWKCPQVCTDDEVEGCDIQARRDRVGPYACEKENGEAKCVSIGCPMYACKQPRPGCWMKHDTDKKGNLWEDEYGCTNPCGWEYCPSDCTEDQQQRCGDKQQLCKLDADLKPTCFTKCDKPVCRDPPKNCKAVPKRDNWGCDMCPEWDCEEPECSAVQADVCCPSEKRAGAERKDDCRKCVLVAGEPKCKPKRCPKKRCRPSTGCWYVESDERDATGCPINGGCGVEKCRPVDPCDTVRCEKGKKCVLVGAEKEPKCVKPSRTCADKQCERGEECVERKGGAVCKPVDPCKKKRCKKDFECVVNGDETVCVDPDVAKCWHQGEPGCPAKWTCEPKRAEQPVRGSLTVYECVPPTDECKDECCRNREPCDYTTERCSVKRGVAKCVDKEKECRADPCARIRCAAKHHCQVSDTGCTAECVEDESDPCGGCRADERCTKDKKCEPIPDPECEEKCADGEVCARTGGGATCVADKCKDFEWPPEGACRDDTHCPEDFFCPAPLDADTGVTRYCGCDPATGRPSLCSASALDEKWRMCEKRDYDCDGDLTKWSEGKREWCCGKMQRGCGDDGYVCDPAVDGVPPKKWSEEKKKFCCDKAGKRAKTPWCEDEKPHNCRTREVWSFEKHTYCCNEESISCPAPKYDCGMRRKGMTKDQRKWCCANKQEGCKKDDLEVDCSEERDLLSKRQRDYCCSTENVHCKENKPPRFSCKKKEKDQWTSEQARYCCKNKGKGCADEDEECYPRGTKKCAHACDTRPRKGSAQQKWCCDEAAVWCPGDYENECEVATTATPKDKCCREARRGCSVECPANNDDLAVAALDAKSKEFCCNVLGVACPAPVPAPESKLPAAVKSVIKFIVTLFMNWDVVQRSPRMFAELLVKTLVALLPDTKTFLRLFEGGILEKDGTVPVDGMSKRAKTKTSLAFEAKRGKEGKTDGKSAESAMRTAQSLGLRVHRVGTTLSEAVNLVQGEKSSMYASLEAESDKMEDLQAAINALSDGIAAGPGSNEGSTIPLDGAGLIKGTPEVSTLAPESGSDAVLPTVLSLAGALLCGGLIALAVMQMKKRKAVHFKDGQSVQLDSIDGVRTQEMGGSTQYSPRGAESPPMTI